MSSAGFRAKNPLGMILKPVVCVGIIRMVTSISKPHEAGDPLLLRAHFGYPVAVEDGPIFFRAAAPACERHHKAGSAANTAVSHANTAVTLRAAH